MTAPRRRWSFSLRALLAAVTVCGIVGGWVAYQINWIHRRHAVLRWSPILVSVRGNKQAPPPLGLFGEAGVAEVITTHDKDAPELSLLKALYPEAEVYSRNEWH